MKVIGTIVGLFALVMGAAAVAALQAKQRIVPNHDEAADEVALVAIFAPVMFHSTASSFRGGTLDCWYGGGIVDLRDATLDPAGAHLDVKSVFGGAQVLVPDSWRVESSVSGIGAAQDMRTRSDRPATAPLLTLSGLAIFGGIGVNSQIDEDAVAEVTEAVEAAEAAKATKARAKSAATNGHAAAAEAINDALAEASPSA
jgi:hypothetical protein